MLRRNIVLMIVSLLVGPPLATIVFFVLKSLVRLGPMAFAALDVNFLVASFPFAYLLGWSSMLAAAIGNMLVARVVNSEGLRLVLSMPIGALAFGLFLSWLAQDDKTGKLDAASMMEIGIAGAAASLVSLALVEAFSPAKRAGN